MEPIYRLNGRTVTRKQFLKNKRGLGDGPAMTQFPGTWPQHSWAMGVLPQQIEEARAMSAHLGVPTEFDRKGRAIFTSREHRKRHCDAFGYGDFDGGYGDPQFRRR